MKVLGWGEGSPEHSKARGSYHCWNTVITGDIQWGEVPRAADWVHLHVLWVFTPDVQHSPLHTVGAYKLWKRRSPCLQILLHLNYYLPHLTTLSLVVLPEFPLHSSYTYFLSTWPPHPNSNLFLTCVAHSYHSNVCPKATSQRWFAWPPPFIITLQSLAHHPILVP
jgi:hypothetical protein